MKFFTDKTVKNDFLLIKIKDYIKLREKGNDFSQWKEVFIDPGVYDLIKSDKFKWEGEIDISRFLYFLPKNHYFSWDYPGDMNLQYQDLFLEKTWKNAVRFHNYTQFIVTTQYRYRDYFNFREWFDMYNDLEIKSGILALGNMCRFRSLNQYLKYSLGYAFRKCHHNRIHIYGLCLKAIPYANKLAKRFNIELSIDSTKWTFIFYEHESKDRQVQYNLYLQKILERGVILENEI